MHLNFLFAAAALVQSSLQAPPPPPNQKPDACAKAVSSGPPKPPQGAARTDVAKADCSSFLSQIVVPCAVTSTTVLTSIKTAKAATKTNTQSITTTNTAIVTNVATVDRTVVLTKQQMQLTTLVLPQNSIALTTETAMTTSTVFETVVLTTIFSTTVVTSTPTATSALQRRDTSISVLPDRPHHATLPSNATLNARQNIGKCSPSVFTPDNVPDYASPCRDLKSYSTACQKLGVTGKTMTVPASTSYTTKTTTTITTPTMIVNVTKIYQATTTQAQTNLITQLHTSIENTTTTQTLTSTSTSTLTSTLTSYLTSNTTLTTTLTTSLIATSTALITPTPSPSSCTSNFRLSVIGTPATVGTYIRTFGASEKLSFTPNITLSSIFSLDAASRLYEPSTNLYTNTDAGGLYYVYGETAGTVESAGYLYLQCEVSEEEGRLRCTARNGGDGFYWCPVIGPPDALVFGSEEGRVAAGGWDCVGLGVRVECV